MKARVKSPEDMNGGIDRCGTIMLEGIEHMHGNVYDFRLLKNSKEWYVCDVRSGAGNYNWHKSWIEILDPQPDNLVLKTPAPDGKYPKWLEGLKNSEGYVYRPDELEKLIQMAKDAHKIIKKALTAGSGGIMGLEEVAELKAEMAIFMKEYSDKPKDPLDEDWFENLIRIPCATAGHAYEGGQAQLMEDIKNAIRNKVKEWK